MSRLCYPDGQEILPGDILGPGYEIDGHTSRVVLVVESRSAVAGFNIDDWVGHLCSGILVENENASGKRLIHYPTIDEDFELLKRA